MEVRLAAAPAACLVAGMSSKEQAVADIVAETKTLPEDVDWQSLSERVRLLAGMEKARADVRAGRVCTTAEIKADLREWLKKQSGTQPPGTICAPLPPTSPRIAPLLPKVIACS
jgi:hypothetical protein